ncbi:GTPase Obg [Candidatus Lokiarchaeum ossiferum]|uniref:GTPase Obg n=1 Tax=Candidatus Lokiarchaeum ossiferum TaxID=2951803 RepID=A0ABY6HYT8_9ARCH|nr:GTPase Obg [Candidatus Lokiarchaeum sp. B-35]
MSEKIEEKIREYEERLARTQKNKATQKSINYTRAQIAKLRNQLITIASKKTGGGSGYNVKKHGDAQVAFIGFPSVGKSSLLNLLTRGNTESKVASYEFTTVSAIPGMMDIESANIQLVDLPGIILGAASGKGRGREILGCVRSADLVLILICFNYEGMINFEDLNFIRNELHNAGIRLNQKKARIVIKKRTRGGIGFSYNGDQIMDQDEVKGLMNELGYSNASVYFSEPMITPDQLIDFVMGNRIYTKEFVVINKQDLARKKLTNEDITQAIGHDGWVKISALNKENIDDLRHRIFQELDLIRIYLKPPQQEADMDDPIIMKKGDDIERLCLKLHKNILANYRYTLIWGPSAKHPGQKFINRDHVLLDGDVVSIYVKR